MSNEDDLESLLPPATEVPTGLDHPAFRLRPLGPEHNERDHVAWTSSIGHIRSTPGFVGRSWPQPMSLEENLADLEMHARHFEQRQGFTFTVLEPDGPEETADVIGCVYVYGDDESDAQVQVRSWVRDDHADLDALLATTVRAWLESDAWPWTEEEIRDHPRGTVR